MGDLAVSSGSWPLGSSLSQTWVGTRLWQSGLPAGGPHVHSFSRPAARLYMGRSLGWVLRDDKDKSVMDSASILSALVPSEDLYINLL